MSWGLPEPSGPYPVACQDVLNRLGKEGIMFRIYYPTKNFERNEENCPLLMDPDHLSGLAGFMGGGIASKILKCYFNGWRIPVFRNGPLVMPEKVSKLPVVLVSHGLGLSKNGYSYICNDLASHGFFVAAVDHRDQSACASVYMEAGESDGGEIKKTVPFRHMSHLPADERAKIRYTQVEQRVQDIKQLMDCVEELNEGALKNILLPDFDLKTFENKIDEEKCSVIGHSFGGGTTIASLATDKRIKVGVAMDAWMIVVEEKFYKMKIEKPMLFLNLLGELKKFDIVKMRQLDADVTGITAERKMVTIIGTTHLTQCDFGFFPKTMWIAKLFSRGSTDPKLANDINTKLLLSFIGKHLDLPCGGEVDDLVKEYSQYVVHGSNIKVDEKEIQAAKSGARSVEE